jgi:hypothetical protein
LVLGTLGANGSRGKSSLRFTSANLGALAFAKSKTKEKELNNNSGKKFRGNKVTQSIVLLSLAAFAIVALVPRSAVGYGKHEDSLVRFDGAIGVDPISNVVVTGTTTTVSANVVRGISPAGQIWRIADLDANVTTEGRIRVRGRGLLLGGGNAIGTNGGQSVFATLFCGSGATATVSSSNQTGVALDSDGDFTIDDVLSPLPTTSCETPTLLIRTAAGAHPWFAAGIEK